LRRSGGGSRVARRYTVRTGGLGIVPSGACPDCEVLAALVPERVLPFASGDSRKRGLSRAGMKPATCRGGAPKGERARSVGAELYRDPAPVLPAKGEQESGCAPHRLMMRSFSTRVSRRSASLLFKGGDFLGMLLGLAFGGVSKARVRTASRERRNASSLRSTLLASSRPARLGLRGAGNGMKNAHQFKALSEPTMARKNASQGVANSCVQTVINLGNPRVRTSKPVSRRVVRWGTQSPVGYGRKSVSIRRHSGRV
jgi:hypothetical protein